MNLQIFYPQWNYEFKFRVWQADSILIQGPDSHFPKNTIYMSQETCKVRNIIWANPARKRRTKSNILAETISIILADFYKLRTMKKVNSLGEMFQWICNMFFIEEKFVPWMQCHRLKQFSFFFWINSLRSHWNWNSKSFLSIVQTFQIYIWKISEIYLIQK